MNLNNLSIRYKLLGTFIGLSIIVVLITLISAHSMKNIHSLFSNYVNSVAVRMTLANDILDAGNQRAISARNLIILSSKDELDAENDLVTVSQQKLDVRFDKLSKLISDKEKVSDKERDLFNELFKIETEYKLVAKNVVATANSGDKEKASKLVGEQCRPLLIKLIKATGSYLDYVNTVANKEVTNAENSSTQSVYTMLIVSAISILIAMIVSLIIISKVINSINEAVLFTKTVAQGDLRNSIKVVSTDETGVLLQSLSEMNDSLIQIVSTVRDSSENIRIGSAEIATANNDLSQRTERQASSLEETSATMEQMNASIRNNSASTQSALILAQKASDTAAKGGLAVSNVVTTMKEINESSSKIADIISSIDGIAFQTNILALNAAVEAARAGDNGRGFAVVATEVRMLAQRSATAAKEIKTLIENSVNRVEAGQELVEQARNTMNEIVEQVQSVTKTISDIRDASMEQSTGVAQVTQAISQLDQTTQQNAALVEQSAATADSLKQQASGLANAVQIFKL